MDRSAPKTTRPSDLHRRAAWTMVFCALCWSIAGVVSRHLERAASLEVTFWRSAVCLAVVLAALAVRHRGRWWQPLASVGAVGWLSGSCWAVMFTCFMVAITRTTVANTLVVLAVAPLLSALLARAVLAEPIRASTWAAIGAAGAGIVWMVHDQFTAAGSAPGGGPGGAAGAALPGMMIAAGVPVAASVNVVALKKWGARVDLVPAVAIGALLSCAVTLPAAWPLSATNRDLALLALLGTVQLAMPCMLMVGASRHLAPQEIALLALLEVVFGPLWAWLGAGERPSDATLEGGAIVLAALVANELASRRMSRASPGM